MAVDLARRLAVARGDAPADVVVRGGRVLSVFTREWLEASVAIADGWIAGIGEYEGNETVDATGKHVVPGFMDAHMHLESSKLLPDEFARLVLPLGTTTVVADPHELANVLGSDGVHWLLDASAEIPLDVFFMASSCVPASVYESPRRSLTVGDLEGLLRRRRVIGLAEMMNFPGVVAGDEHELAKLALATHVDGHAPGVRGRELQAYAAAGIRSDHEASTADEGRERLRGGIDPEEVQTGAAVVVASGFHEPLGVVCRGDAPHEAGRDPVDPRDHALDSRHVGKLGAVDLLPFTRRRYARAREAVSRAQRPSTVVRAAAAFAAAAVAAACGASASTGA